MSRLVTVAVSLAVGCASQPPVVRFANAPAADAVDDRRDVPKPPAKRRLVNALYHFDGSFHRRSTRALELQPARRALGINALDEVPDSTWFTNRIGVRELSLDELRTGPSSDPSPELYKPWTIDTTKVEGESPGLVVKDARGIRYVLKFERRGNPEVETGAHVIVNRLLWGFGYNVPDDRIVYLRREDLAITQDSIARDILGNEDPFTPADLDKILSAAEVDPDGRIRAIASRMLDGQALGGHPSEGVRRDDPNDLIPHELRRDLRGARAVFAWLDHVDVKDDNSLDMWIADRADPTRHYVEHYWIDFNSGLGAMAVVQEDPRRGHEFVVDPAEMLGSFITAGTRVRDWEGRTSPELRGVGLFASDHFDPGTWKPFTPAYVPVMAADHLDWFWAAKKLARFTPAQLRAVVEAAAYTDPRAAAYITRTLIERQRAVAAYAFTRINPLDRFEVESKQQLCFEDLLLVHRLGRATETRYRLRTLDRTGRPLGALRTVSAGPGGCTCTAPLAFARTGDGYTIVELTTLRPGFARTTSVHLARDPQTTSWRVIGVWRD